MFSHGPSLVNDYAAGSLAGLHRVSVSAGANHHADRRIGQDILAYAVLLSVFGANSLFTLLYLHRGRQELAANQRRLEVQVAVDAALRSLEDFSRSRANDSTGVARGLTSRVAAQNGIASARQNLRDALVSVDQY